MTVCPTCKIDGAMSLIGETGDKLVQWGHLCNTCRFTASMPLPNDVRKRVQRLLAYPGNVGELIGSDSGYLVIAVELEELDEEACGIWLQVLQAEKNA